MIKLGQIVRHTMEGTMPYGKVVELSPKSHGSITFKNHGLGVLIDTEGYANDCTSKLPGMLKWCYQGYLV